MPLVHWRSPGSQVTIVIVRQEPRPVGLHFQLYTLGRDGPVHWRLLSGNNRDLGRGSERFPDEETCLSTVQALLTRRDELEVGLSRTPDGRWGFTLSVDGEVVVASGHGFDRRTRCAQAARRFVQLAGEAELRHGVTALFASGQGRA